MSFDAIARRVDAACVRAFRTPEVTLGGVPVAGVFDTQSEVVMDDGVVTQVPTLTIQASVAGAVAPGANMAIGAGGSPTGTPVQGLTLLLGMLVNPAGGGAAYRVRRVLELPPDGQLLQLVLARA